MAASARGNLKITQYTSISSEQAHVLDATTYKFRIVARTKGVRLKLITTDAANWVTIILDTYQDFDDVKSMSGRTIYVIEDAATASVQIIEWRNDVTAIS